jgi:hypothetical protein
MGTATSIISAPNQDEMLKQASEYNQRTNRRVANGLFSIFATVTPVLIETVLHKETNLVNKTVTYMFQKCDNTFVKLTMAMA